MFQHMHQHQEFLNIAHVFVVDIQATPSPPTSERTSRKQFNQDEIDKISSMSKASEMDYGEAILN